MSDWVVPDTLVTPEQFGTWIGAQVPANAVPLLRSCTAMVYDATKLSIYATDTSTGLPSDPTILQCMQDATCIQAAAWMALKIDPLAGGVSTVKVVTSKKIGSGAITYSNAGADATAAAQLAATTQLVPDAVKKLRQQNLISHWPSREYGYGNTPGVWPNLV